MKNIKLFNRYLIAAILSVLTVEVATTAISSHNTTGKMQIIAAEDSSKSGTGG
jgi:hypothetical protein